ncbi:transferrin-binding protein-like solute binding protein [Taylorella equigenitalis]|uniref:Transferrin-binding protein B n=1 Tax=Taylorella equigenitalis ATCC 35865 TaxID=743973 RepID=A0ABM5N949_9BURK|nr:transferrin-binding protein-like solute binding protein [Taylorella equigenitalis]AFN35399.1 putative lactoferrin-binding protein [Taylorella equigenitalis ATCC 35865]ASY38830.1 transferrin-binding protein-like solute binding protein [Taylorella equigenitalis]VEG30434.1 Transferrin-binding protein 2 precursor [Taylorella equigenitalis ATCC 35865]
MNKKIFYASLLALGLTACGGRGSFDTLSIKENIDTVKPGKQNNQDNKPSESDVIKPEAKGVMRPSLGYAVAVPVRDVAKRDESGKFLEPLTVEGKTVAQEREIRKPIDDSKAIPLLDGDLEYVYIDGKEKFPVVRDFEKGSNQFDYKYVRAGIVKRKGNSTIDKYNENEDLISSLNNIEAYAYYKGSEAASALPTDKSVVYDGHWEYMTDARLYRNNKGDVRKGIPEGFNTTSAQGYEHGAMSISHEYRPLFGSNQKPEHRITNNAHFEVNFAEKSLKGKLDFGTQTTRFTGDVTYTPKYDIVAKLYGNRFVGSALALDEPGNEIKATYANATNKLEGGFFGPKAEELAGNFITDDNSLYGVFAAKQKNASQNIESVVLAQFLDTTYGKIKQSADIKEVTFDEEGKETTKQYKKELEDLDVPGAQTTKNLSLFENIDKLIIDGRELNLVPGRTVSIEKDGRRLNVTAYKGDFEYLRLGKVFKSGFTKVGEEEQVESGDSEEEDSNKEITQKITTVYPDQDGYFVQGALTESKNVPNQGVAKYDGVWGGKIYYFNRAIGTNHNTAHFDVDFGERKIKGDLKDFGAKVFEIDASIDKNTFTGKVTSVGEIKLDNAVGGTTHTSSARFDIKDRDIAVTGAFFGPKADELAGSFSGKGNLKGDSNGKTEADIGVVFGAKKTN